MEKIMNLFIGKKEQRYKIIYIRQLRSKKESKTQGKERKKDENRET